MTSLEFIEKEIERYEIIIIGVKTMLKDARPEKEIKFLTNDLNEYEEKIKYLQQIKNEIEAWEVVKEILGLNVEKITSVYENDIERYILVYKNRGSCIKMYTSIEQQEYETLKKTLEVNE
jgi:translation initiation factor 2 beta subunit (eIF-2beta)/eIF-5